MPSFSLSNIFRRAGGLLAVAATVLVVGGCGAVQAESAPQTASASTAGVVLSITGTEYAFTPPALTASAGKATIRFTNKGVVEHDFTIDALHVKISAKPGKTAEATVTLTAGTYTFYCTIPGHLQSGMQGKLTVS
ncbi:MAG: cupredoxin domain-containing protein [Actinomycetota bacterium]